MPISRGWVETGAGNFVLAGACALVLCLGLLSGVEAQDAADPLARTSVFLETDSTAVKKLGAARDALSAKKLTPREWADVVDLLRQIAEQHKDKLVAVESGRYVGVPAYCDILLAGLPPDGLKVYRARVDPLARQWFEAGKAAHDEELLLKVVRQAVISSYGDDALLLLGELAWEKGDLSRARSYWQQLIPPAARGEAGQPGLVLAYPDSNLDPALIRARIVLCSLMQGNLPRGREEIERFKEQYSQTQGTLAGRTGNLSQILTDLADEASVTQFPADDPAVATFAFDPQRSKVLPEAVDVGKSQWSVLLREADPANAEGLADAVRLPFGFQNEAGHYPVVFNDIVLVCDETSVYAYKLQSGQPAWPAEELSDEERATETAEALRNRARIYSLPPEQMQAAAFPGTLAGFPRFTLTVEQGRLYARLGSLTTVRPGGVRARCAASFLICLDLARGQGKQLWMIDADQIEPNRENWSFEGAPLVSGGRVYVALRRNTSQPQANVACYDAETGKLIWNRKVCVGMSSLGVEEHELSHQLLTWGEERLYYNTNLGAIAAIEPQDGTLRWVATYPRADAESLQDFNERHKHGPNPCVYHAGTVYAAPADCDRLFAYDADTGIPRWGKDAGHLDGKVRTLLGVGKGRLILAGDQLWGVDLETGIPDWKYEARNPYGRGLLVEDLIYWPTREEIVFLNQATGRPVRDPVNLKEKGAQGGNLLISGGLLLVARHDWLVAFSEYGGVKQRRQEEIVRRPDAALPHYRLALVDEAGGEYEQALVHFRQAQRLARPEELRDTLPLKELAAVRLHDLLQQLALRAISKQDYPAAAARYAEALEQAPGPKQHAASLWGLGTSLEQKQTAREAVAAYQRILDAAAQGGWSRNGTTEPYLALYVPARQRIDSLISKQGRSVYAPFDAAAEEALADGFRRGDTQQVESTLERYPNAKSAEPAALRLAEMQHLLKQHTAAMQTCKRLLAVQTTSAPVRQAALAQLARISEAEHLWRVAARTWRQLAQEFPQARLTERGREWTAAEFVSQHLGQDVFREQVSAAGFGIALPLLRRWDHPQAAGSTTIVPVGTPPSVDLGCVLLQGTNIACLNEDDGTLRWQTSLAENLAWAGYAGHLLLFATPERIFGVTLTAGRTVWETRLHADRPAAAWCGDVPARTAAKPGQEFHSAGQDSGKAASPEARYSLSADEDRLYCLRPGRDLCAIDRDDGRIAWRFCPRAGDLARFWHCGPRHIVVQAQTPDRVVVLDPRDGAVQFDIVPPTQTSEASTTALARWICDPLALSNGNLGLVGADRRIQLFDPAQGTLRWTYVGPLSHAHASPILLTNGTALLLVVDATTLVRVDPETGARLWSRSLGPDLLPEARHVAYVAEQQVFVPAGGVLRCFALQGGDLVWEQYLGKRDVTWRVIKSGRYVAAYPLAAAGRFPLVVCDAATGEYVQQLNFDGPAKSVLVHAGPHMAVLDAGTSVFGLADARDRRAPHHRAGEGN